MKNKDQLIADFISALKNSPLLFKGEELDEKLINQAIEGNFCEYGLLSIKSKFLKQKRQYYNKKHQFIARFDGFNGVNSFFSIQDDETKVLCISDHNLAGGNLRPNKCYCTVFVVNIKRFTYGYRQDFALPMNWIKTRAAQALERQAQYLNMDFSRSIAKCIQNKVNDLLCGKEVAVWINKYGVNWRLNGEFITNAEALKVPESESEIDDLALEIAEAVEITQH